LFTYITNESWGNVALAPQSFTEMFGRDVLGLQAPPPLGLHISRLRHSQRL
jgi:hypothetical protein